MTAREWQPGDVAMVDDPAYGERIMVRRDTPALGSCWHALDDDRCLDAKQAGDARPLVVIDPEDREQTARLADLFCAERWCHTRTGDTDDCDPLTRSSMQAALREFANPTPPKPEEPTGLGAVVERSDGKRWVRGDKGWMNLDASGDYLNWSSWEGLNVYAPVVRVLSEGVTQ